MLHRIQKSCSPASATSKEYSASGGAPDAPAAVVLERLGREVKIVGPAYLLLHIGVELLALPLADMVAGSQAMADANEGILPRHRRACNIGGLRKPYF